MKTSSLFQKVRKQPFFEGFSAGQIKKAAATASEVRFAPEEIMVREGVRSDYFYLLLAGKVALEVYTPYGAVTVQSLGPGDELGWSSMRVAGEAQFHARALTPVEALAFLSSRMLQLCDEDPALGYALMRGLLGIAQERLHALRAQFLAVDVSVA
ncbi:MAG: Crp/Fnr family transcriptional regulator [Bryobacteraceae bacterium]|nr:Crp/Fnr family transcriptional regulator [Bryobacteraceae bacterium]